MAMGGDARRVWSELQGRVTDAARKWTDPREKLLRKTRRARRRTARFGGLTVFSAAGTGTLALSSAPEWTIVAGGGVTVLAAVPAVVAWQKFREYRARPLPPRRPARRFEPHHASAVHSAMTRMSAAEQSLYRLVLVLNRSNAIPSGEADEILRATMAAGDALETAARDTVGMEYARTRLHATGDRTGAAADLAEPIRNLTAHINRGVAEVEDLTATAARMTDAALGMSREGVLSGLDQQRDDLLSVTDRVAGLTSALQELRGLSQQYASPLAVRPATRGAPRTSPDLRASGLT
ncbi:phage shock envelope stress response protein PspM [Hoyosella altamirensis]|uniref:Uncharacterized protein n=1 Tax=Hoyosella altamirensis TaxID=616997 RepID=A0A839RNE4_9ACTN|nr:hypothetical protein [Hoyosella altamirensis]MBB3038502.1 hypothetical protein [Hoyosella altamirensis]